MLRVAKTNKIITSLLRKRELGGVYILNPNMRHNLTSNHRNEGQSAEDSKTALS